MQDLDHRMLSDQPQHQKNGETKKKGQIKTMTKYDPLMSFIQIQLLLLFKINTPLLQD